MKKWLRGGVSFLFCGFFLGTCLNPKGGYAGRSSTSENGDQVFLRSQSQPVLYYVCLNVRAVAETSPRHPCSPSRQAFERARVHPLFQGKMDFVSQTIGKNRMAQLQGFSEFVSLFQTHSQWDLDAVARFLFLEKGKLVNHLEVTSGVKESEFFPKLEQAVKQSLLGTRSMPVSLMLSPPLFDAIEKQSIMNQQKVEELIEGVLRSHFLKTKPDPKAP